jgi:hypothetical protein
VQPVAEVKRQPALDIKHTHMKINRFIDGAIATDGGTISCRAELDNGTVWELGLDARIPKTKDQRQIFIGAGYPTLPGSSILDRGSNRELEVIAAIQDYLDRKCGFLQREALMEAAPSTLDERDCGDLMAVTLVNAILER